MLTLCFDSRIVPSGKDGDDAGLGGHMLKSLNLCIILVILAVGGFVVPPALAQSATSDDAVIDAIRGRSSIESLDQARILQWIEGEIDELKGKVEEDPLAAEVRFRTRLTECNQDTRNSAQFRAELARQMTRGALTHFGDATLDGTAARALARVLVDLDPAETHAGLLAGLKSKDQGARFLCARGLAAQKTAIAQDNNKLGQTIAALREAGLAETSSVVLAHIYAALAHRNQISAVFEAYITLFDKRIEYRRGTAVFVDRAELDAFDFFRSRGVIDSLSAEQKTALTVRLAVFLRADAERYNATDLGTDEADAVERRLDGGEACLDTLVGTGRGGTIRDELRDGGYARRDAVLQQAYRWVGNPATQSAGALNTAPWNVPIGAP
ncbi:MAG: hypothetical protein JSU63_18535 [Phycisphaerales bacterium]|nr:MAG: hypothetical protein JSU63_18535 [Phycisphaerales bacterium]